MAKKSRANNKNWFTSFFFWLFCATIFLICVAILNAGLSFNLPILLCITLLLGLLLFLKRKSILSFFFEHNKIFLASCIALILFGVILRLCFLLIGDRFNIEATLSDTGVQWYGAQQIVTNGGFDQEVGDYESVYPFLFPYTFTLSIFMRIFGVEQSAIVLSNTFLDIISGFLIYLLFMKWKQNKKAGLFAATLWAINPLEIVFCSLPLAIVIVNLFVVLSIVCSYFYFKNNNKLIKTIILAFLVGGILSIANAYRPIFTVFLIAVLVYGVYKIISEKRNISNEIIGLICVCVVYFIVGLIPSTLHTRVNSYYHGEKSSAAWSIFVGANYASHGKWNSDDRDLFFGPVLIDQADKDVEKAQRIILRRGISRYKDILIERKLLSHMMNKTEVLFGDVKNAVYDFPYVYHFHKENVYYKLMQDCILIFYLSLIVSIVYMLWLKKFDLINKRNDHYKLFLIILFIGLFTSSLLVEVMNRYSLPFIAIMIIMLLGFVLPSKTKKLKHDRI